MDTGMTPAFGEILRKAYDNGLHIPSDDLLQEVLCKRQSENVIEAHKPCEHGSISGTKIDCKICFVSHFMFRAIRN